MRYLSSLCILMSFVIPFIIFGTQKYRQYNHLYILPTWTMMLIALILFWVTVQLGVYCTEVHLDNVLNSFDIDGNGVFTTEEESPEFREALHNVISDTGRALAPITGAIFGIFYICGIWIVGSYFFTFIMAEIEERRFVTKKRNNNRNK